MVMSMATVKVTVTLQEEQLAEIRELVDRGQASSVSGYVQSAVCDSLDVVEGWKQMLSEVLEEHGPPTEAEQRWLDEAMAIARGDQ